MKRGAGGKFNCGILCSDVKGLDIIRSIVFVDSSIVIGENHCWVKRCSCKVIRYLWFCKCTIIGILIENSIIDLGSPAIRSNTNSVCSSSVCEIWIRYKGRADKIFPWCQICYCWGWWVEGDSVCGSIELGRDNHAIEPNRIGIKHCVHWNGIDSYLFQSSSYVGIVFIVT